MNRPIAADDIQRILAVTMPEESIPEAIISASVSFTAFGTSAVMVHLYAVDKAHPYFFAILRLTFSIPLFFLASVIAEGGVPRRPQSSHELLHIFLIGLLSVVLQISVTMSYFLTNSLAVGIFQLCLPVLVTVASILTGTEKKPDFSKIHGWIRVLTILPTLGGAITLVVLSSKNENEAPKHCGFSTGEKSQQADWTLGVIFLMLFLTTFTAMIITQTRLFTRYKEWGRRPVTVLAWATPLAYPIVWIFLPAAAAIVKAKTTCGETIGLWTLKGTAVWALEWHIYFNATSCVMLLAFASACASPSIVSFFAPMEPITAVILSQFLLDYSITAGQYICMAVVVCGFLAFVWAQHKEETIRKENERRRSSTASGKVPMIDLSPRHDDLLATRAVHALETSV